MGSRWFCVVVDALDPVRLAAWWAEVLDYRVKEEAADEVLIGPEGDSSGPQLSFVAVPDPKDGKNRLHLDLAPTDQDAEVERLLDMGAREVILCVFADKDLGHPKPVQADIVGVTIPNRFVVGFGMDAHGYWRNLPGLWVVREDDKRAEKS